MRLARHLLVLILLALLVQPRCLLAGELKNLDQDEWMGVYVGPKKVGYMHIKIQRDEFQGKPAYLKTTDVKVRFQVGVESTSDVSCKLYASEDFSPLSANQRLRQSYTENGTVRVGETEIDADYIGMRITIKGTVDGKRNERTSDVPQKEMDFRPGIMYEFDAKRLTAGEEIQLCHMRFIDLAMLPQESRLRMNLCAKARMTRSGGQAQLGGKTFDAYEVEETYDDPKAKPIPTMKVYTDSGRLLGIRNKTLVSIVVETRDEALKALEGDPPNVLPYVPIIADRDIPNPDYVTELKIRLVGVSDMGIARSDIRQKAVSSADDKTIEYHVVAESFPPGKSQTLPIRTTGYEKWLQDESPYVQVKDKAIQDLAAEIIGAEENAYLAASKIRAWVYENTRHKGPLPENVCGFRPAKDILKARSGDCMAKAVLFIALARAAGMPTRLASGLACSGGVLNGHGWAEVFVGEWVALDPGLSSDWLPATTVKLFDGSIEEATKQELYPVIIGGVHVVEYWPMDVTPANPLHETAPPGSVVIKEPDGTMTAFPPGTRTLVVPESGSVTYKRADGHTATLKGKTPGSMLVVHPGDCTIDYPPGSEVIVTPSPRPAPADSTKLEGGKSH